MDGHLQWARAAREDTFIQNLAFIESFETHVRELLQTLSQNESSHQLLDSILRNTWKYARKKSNYS